MKPVDFFDIVATKLKMGFGPKIDVFLHCKRYNDSFSWYSYKL